MKFIAIFLTVLSILLIPAFLISVVVCENEKPIHDFYGYRGEIVSSIEYSRKKA